MIFYSKLLILFLSCFVMNPSWDDATLYKFQGEIVDSKCALGAMTPGDRKTHRICAIKCIKNGIPPLLKVKFKDHYRYYLLVSEGKTSANEQVLPYVGDQVEISGSVIKDANMVMIEISSIKRLDTNNH